MLNKLLASAAAAAVIIGGSSAAEAQDNGAARSGRPGRELGYFLPRTRVAATVVQRLARCPNVADPQPGIVTEVGIEPGVGADSSSYVRVDTRSGFLSGRTTRLALRANGTLESFNASTAGEGAAVLSAVISTAASIGASAIGLPSGIGPLSSATAGTESLRSSSAPLRLRCNRRTAERIARLTLVQDQIAELEGQIAEGQSTPASTGLLDRLRADEQELQAQLTLASPGGVVFNVGPADFPAGGPPDQRMHIAPVDYAEWFDSFSNSSDERTLIGIGAYGFRASLKPNRRMLEALAGGGRERVAQRRHTVPLLS